MTTKHISLPDSLTSFKEVQVRSRGYGAWSECVRELPRKKQDRQRLLSLLDAGASSTPGPVANRSYFDGLRAALAKCEP